MPRALARERPDLVRQVISLGSPYRMVEGDLSSATSLWKQFEHLHDADIDINRIAEQHRPKLTVPATSIYSRRDGVAPWQTCIDEVGPLAENIEVHGSHAALGAHPAVTFAVLDRLRVPEGEWRPFRPSCMVKAWYPRPASWRRRRRSTVTSRRQLMATSGTARRRSGSSGRRQHVGESSLGLRLSTSAGDASGRDQGVGVYPLSSSRARVI